ncbi:cell wall-binding repeat-containing protein [Salipaludibacillus sp. CF4.18]|uniref:cell wall-binding repeat-containing protein n=1 Tax=Salipaludibacillus sp. CF4.18 TaxID=3373081 RepID=UPI003EE67132
MKHYFVSKSKVVISALIFLLVFNGVFASIPVAAQSDSEPPIVHNVVVSPQEVGVGDEVTIQAEVTDDNSGVRSSTIDLYSPSRNRSEYIPLSFNPETELWEAVYKIKETDEEGQWTLRYISGRDHAGNSTLYYPRDFENSEQIGFKVINSEGDSEPPVVQSVKVSPQEAGVGDEVTIQAEVTDDNSGVRSSTIDLYSPSRNRSEYIPLSFNPETELWEAVYKIKETDEEGQWTLRYISGRDHAGNSTLYYPRDFENSEQIGFKVINSEGDSEPPVVQSVKVSPQEAGVGDEVTIQAEVTDDNSGVRSSTIDLYSPSRNRSEYIPLSFNPETELWEAVYKIKETDEEGQWTLRYISGRDHAGNSTLYYPRDFENANEIGFIKKESNEPGESLEPLPYHFTTSNETWYNEVIDGDLFIGPQSILTINGDVTVNGDVYVFGAMRNYGDLTITGTLEARSINWGSSSLYNGTVLMLGGSNQIGSMRTSNQRWEVPVEFYNESFVVKDGQIELKGATVPVIDLYIDGEKVNVNTNGTFTIDLEEISSNVITYKTLDVFGHEINNTIDVIHEGVPVWADGQTITVEGKDDTIVSLSWDAATEENGIAFYHLYQDGVKVGQVEGTEMSYDFSNLQSSTSYEFMVIAEGKSGKSSEPLKITVQTEKSAEEIAKEEAISTAYSFIDSLIDIENLTPADQSDVDAARAKVEEALELGASESDIENLSKLVTLEEKLEALKQLEEDKAQAIAKAVSAIESLPSKENLTLADQSDVEAARKKVEEALDLGVDESDIENLSKLVSLEEKLEELNNVSKDTQVDRLSGTDRYGTNLALTASIEDNSLDYVILASGTNYPDALAGGVLNKRLNGTALLVHPADRIMDNVINEAQRLLKPGGEVLIIGGFVAVPESVESRLDTYFDVSRIQGKNRVETTINVANIVNEQPEHVFLVSGNEFADALSIVPYATTTETPILLNQSSNGLSSSLETYFENKNVSTVTIIGGRVAVNEEAETWMKENGMTVERLAGSNRFETAVKIQEKYYPDTKKVMLANGMTFPDALSGGHYASRNQMPILLTLDSRLPSSVDVSQFEGFYLLGGNAAVSENIEEILKKYQP